MRWKPAYNKTNILYERVSWEWYEILIVAVTCMMLVTKKD
jgi:hypothetical protein